MKPLLSPAALRRVRPARLLAVWLAGLLVLGCASVGAAQVLAPAPFDSRAVVPPLLVLALELDDRAREASWSTDYQPQRDYEGYFNHRQCYRPPSRRRAFLSPVGPADALHYCDGQSYSGNFLNWAAMTWLDTLRYALVGGKRVLDTAASTQLERADVGSEETAALVTLRRSVNTTQAEVARLAPFAVGTLYLQSCATRLLLASWPLRDCKRDKPLADIPLRVQVCGNEDEERDGLCRPYGRRRKPEGLLQRASSRWRLSLVGGGLSLPADWIGLDKTGSGWLRQANPGAQWDAGDGTMIPAAQGLLQQLSTMEGSVLTAPGTALRTALDGLASPATADTILASCQRNSVLLLRVADDPGSATRPDLPFWRERVAQLERERASLPGNQPDALATSRELLLGGAALQANSGKLRSDATMAARSYFVEVQRPGKAFALRAVAPYGGFIDSNDDGNPWRASWPYALDPNAQARVEWDSKLDGRPDNWSGAVDGTALLAHLRRSFVRLERDVLQAAMPTLAAASLVHSDSLLLATGESASFSGRLARYPLLQAADGQWSRNGEARWESALAATPDMPLLTTDPRQRMDSKPLALSWESLDAAQQAILQQSPDSPLADGLGQQRLAWLHGDSSTEEGRGGVLRRRLRPGAVATTNLVWTPPSGGHADGVVYVGTSEGLLHALDAATGRPIFAWLPHALVARLPALAAPDHAWQALLDGGLAFGSVEQDGNRRMVLAASLGRAARGVAALDVSEPDRFASEGRVLFEFTQADDARVGYVLAPPQIVQVAMGSGRRPFLLFSAGQGVPAAIFLLALDKPAGEPWREGHNYFCISAAAAGLDSASNLAPASLVSGVDGLLQHVWAGDASGTLWRFSFVADSQTTGFKVRVLPVLRATTPQGEPQPITAAPRVAWAQGPGYVVVAGTGSLLALAEAAPGNARTESLYAIRDDPSQSPGVATRAQLSQRVAQAREDGGYSVQGSQELSAASRGWVLDFPVPGERVVDAPVLLAGQVLVQTAVVPQQPCDRTDTRLWQLGVLDGLAPTSTGRSILRALQTPLLLSSRPEGRPDSFGRVEQLRVSSIYFHDPGPEGSTPDLRLQQRQPSGRLSWREIFNWRQLHEAAIRP